MVSRTTIWWSPVPPVPWVNKSKCNSKTLGRVIYQMKWSAIFVQCDMKSSSTLKEMSLKIYTCIWQELNCLHIHIVGTINLHTKMMIQNDSWFKLYGRNKPVQRVNYTLCVLMNDETMFQWCLKRTLLQVIMHPSSHREQSLYAYIWKM